MNDGRPLPGRVSPSGGLPAARPAGRETLSLEAALDLVVCGLLLAGLSFLAHHLQPSLWHGTLTTGLAGGGLCILWGAQGRGGTFCRRGGMLTLALGACVFVHQAAQSWAASAAGESKGRMVAALMTVLVLCCLGMVATLAQEGKKAPPP